MRKPVSVALRVDLPRWLRARVPGLTPLPAGGRDAAAMRLAVDLADENVRRGDGGPFGAVVADAGGRILGLGVNLVRLRRCSVLHAEIVALMMAQRSVGLASLDAIDGRLPVTLYTSVEPCDMCLGALRWSGVRRLVCGATSADAEAIGFDEGPRSDHWVQDLRQRGIQVRCGVLRSASRAVLRRYRDAGGEIYGSFSPRPPANPL